MKLSQTEIIHFKKHGYIIAKNIIPKSKIKELREHVSYIFEPSRRFPDDFHSHRFDIYNRYPVFKDITNHKPIRQATASLLGEDFVFSNSTMVAHQDFYVEWHRDTKYCEYMKLDYNREDEFLMLNIGLYLQKNSIEHGGGLDVIPGSHLNESEDTKKKRSLLTNPGDVIFFNQNLMHQATRPSKGKDPDNLKQAIFWGCSVNNESARKYIEMFEQLKPDQLRANSLDFFINKVLKGQPKS